VLVVVGGDAALNPVARGHPQVGDLQVDGVVELVEVEAEQRDVQAAEDGDLLPSLLALDAHEPVLQRPQVGADGPGDEHHQEDPRPQE
jgi:hypothetical protein